jgi:hypothetical protein
MTPEDLTPAAIGRRLLEQDNLATAHPIFLVQQKRRILGLDPAYADDDQITWIDPDGELDAAEAAKIERRWAATGKEPDGLTRTGVIVEWEYVTACLTRVGAEDYIARERHNLAEPRVYVASGYRNAEWIALREFFLKYPQPNA